MIELYRVGGCVRDEIVGVKPHDIDYAVIADSFEDMEHWLAEKGAMVWQSRPQFGSIRAKLNGVNADFTLARSEGFYSDGRHPDEVQVGSLYDDLSRRDLTINAIAKRERDGVIIDPFKGRDDIEARVIRAVGDPVDRISEDALRALRAIRFSITLGFRIEPDLDWAIRTQRTAHAISETVSTERIREELDKMFRFDQSASFDAMFKYPSIFGAAIDKGIWWKPTTEEK